MILTRKSQHKYFFLASSLHSLWIGSAWKEESWPDVSWLEDLWEKEGNNICFLFQNIFCWKSVQSKSHNCKQFSASKLDFILLLKMLIWEICSSDLQGVYLYLLAVHDHLILQVLHWPSTLHYIAHLSRPWSISWVALSFLFCSSRYGDIRPNLHFYFP